MDSKSTHPFHIALADAEQGLAAQHNPQLRFITMLQHGSLAVELYAPEKIDPQQPHRQDEVYIIIAGQGDFINGDVRHRFGPGDVLFVQAGVIHRFEDFSEDFKTWVIFYGPDGGEHDQDK